MHFAKHFPPSFIVFQSLRSLNFKLTFLFYSLLDISCPGFVQGMKGVSGWPTMGFQLTLLLILQINFIKEMYQLLETSLLGKELAILHPSLELYWQMHTGEDIGQLLLFQQFTSLYVPYEVDTPSLLP